MSVKRGPGRPAKYDWSGLRVGGVAEVECAPERRESVSASARNYGYRRGMVINTSMTAAGVIVERVA